MWAAPEAELGEQAEQGGTAKALADGWEREVFELWHRLKAGQLSRYGLADALDPHIASLGDLPDRGCRSRDRVLSRFCGRLRQRYPALWKFAEDGVEPTNNLVERVQRGAVVRTRRLQGRPVLAFLREAVSAHHDGETAPRFIPKTG